MEKLRGNKSNAILQAAEHGKYGVLAIVCVCSSHPLVLIAMCCSRLTLHMG